jgi:peptidyl-prolyl cis-trans isomerase D
MLNFLRKGVKSLPAKILIGLLVASFAVWGIGDIFSLRLDSRVAQVGDTEVSASRFADALAREQSRVSRQARQLVSYDMMRAAGLDRNILAGLIRDAAFTEELATLGILASDRAVVDAVRSDPAFKDPAGSFSDQSYQFVLAQMGMSAKAFEDRVGGQLARSILDETTQAAVTAPPGAGARIAAFQGEIRAVTTLTLTLDMAPDPGTPDEGALRAFYEANEPTFTEPERRWGEYLHVDAAKLRVELVPDEATLRAAYEGNIDAYSVGESRVIDQIPIPDRETADAAMARLISGAASFESLGAEFGVEAEDLSLGGVTRDDLPETAAELIFGEAEPGIVGPVELPIGFAVYRVREITQGGVTPFEDLRDQIAERLATDELLVRAPEIANEIEERRAEGQSMQETAASAGDGTGVGSGITYGTFDGLARDASLPNGGAADGVQANPSFISEVFTALDAEERDLVELPDGGYILVMVERIEPTALQSLSKVRDRAVTAWQTAERLKAIEAQGAELAVRFGQDASIWDIGEELGIAPLPHQPFTRMTPPPALPGPLIEKIFRAANAGGASAPGESGNEVIVAQISSVVPLGPDAMANNSAGLDQVLADSMRQDTADYFARAVTARHGAVIEPGVIDQVFTRLGAVSQPSQ